MFPPEGVSKAPCIVYEVAMTTPRTNTIGETLSKHDEHEDCPPVGSAQHTPSRRKWTMPDNKIRAASEGPWIAIEDAAAFIAFCEAQGHATRRHHDGYQVRHAGHWMGLTHNKSFGRYTADRRLSLVVQSFVAIARTTGAHP